MSYPLSAGGWLHLCCYSPIYPCGILLKCYYSIVGEYKEYTDIDLRFAVFTFYLKSRPNWLRDNWGCSLRRYTLPRTMTHTQK